MKLSRWLGWLGLVALLLSAITPAQAQPADTATQNPVQAPNDHWYQLADAGRGLSFVEAVAAAEAKTYQGLKGHLATINSVDEQTFITNRITIQLAPDVCAWIGGNQKPGSDEPAGGWTWITGEEMRFKNWAAGEPNNAGMAEYQTQIRRDGTWNDVGDGGPTQFFVVEYEDPDNIPAGVVTDDGPLFFNGHWYDMVEAPQKMSWNEARAAAEAQPFRGLKGHLATITTQPEQDFIVNKITGKMPTGSDVAYIGAWQRPGSPEPAGGWTWVTGEPFRFTNWERGEPNDANHREYIAQIHQNGTWNDVGDDSPSRYYVVEFEPRTVIVPKP